MPNQEVPAVILRLIAILSEIAEKIANTQAGKIRTFLILRPRAAWCARMREGLLALAAEIERGSLKLPVPSPAEGPPTPQASAAPPASLAALCASLATLPVARQRHTPEPVWLPRPAPTASIHATPPRPARPQGATPRPQPHPPPNRKNRPTKRRLAMPKLFR